MKEVKFTLVGQDLFTIVMMISKQHKIKILTKLYLVATESWENKFPVEYLSVFLSHN